MPQARLMAGMTAKKGGLSRGQVTHWVPDHRSPLRPFSDDSPDSRRTQGRRGAHSGQCSPASRENCTRPRQPPETPPSCAALGGGKAHDLPSAAGRTPRASSRGTGSTAAPNTSWLNACDSRSREACVPSTRAGDGAPLRLPEGGEPGRPACGRHRCPGSQMHGSEDTSGKLMSPPARNAKTIGTRRDRSLHSLPFSLSHFFSGAAGKPTGGSPATSSSLRTALS